MDLADAIKAADKDCVPPCEPMPWFPAILAAARETLSRRDGEIDSRVLYSWACSHIQISRKGGLIPVGLEQVFVCETLYHRCFLGKTIEDGQRDRYWLRDGKLPEPDKRNRASIEELERLARIPTMTSIHETADLLKVLRERVIPWIRTGATESRNLRWHSCRESEKVSCDEMLRLLGDYP